MGGMRCTVCGHADRAVVDRLLAAGSLSDRRIASQFGLTRASLARHRKNHLMHAIQQQLKRREREDQSAAEVWCGRLEEAYESARRGVARSEADPERWASGIGYLGALNKSIELGLKASGEIEGGRGANVNVIEYVVVLPTAFPTTTPSVDPIELRALPDTEDE
jgi:hypothetical protein